MHPFCAGAGDEEEAGVPGGVPKGGSLLIGEVNAGTVVIDVIVVVLVVELQ